MCEVLDNYEPAASNQTGLMTYRVRVDWLVVGYFVDFGGAHSSKKGHPDIYLYLNVVSANMAPYYNHVRDV